MQNLFECHAPLIGGAFLEEWLKRIPNFRINPEKPIKVHMNSVPGIDELHLIIDP